MQESRSKLQQQLQELRVAQDQQAEEIQRLKAHQSQAVPPNMFGADHRRDVSSGVSQAPTALQAKQHHGQQTTADEKPVEAASVIRHASVPYRHTHFEWPSTLFSVTMQLLPALILGDGAKP